MVARMFVEPVVEPMFCEDSYGYRPYKSAIDAIATARKRCWSDTLSHKRRGYLYQREVSN